MKKEFVPYELAVKLKVLGFDEPCFGYFDTDDNQVLKFDVVYENKNLPAPLYQQAFRWIREKYQLYCGILTEYSYGGQLHAYHITGKRQGDVSIGGFNTYEEAELACLTKLIEIVEQKL